MHRKIRSCGNRRPLNSTPTVQLQGSFLLGRRSYRQWGWNIGVFSEKSFAFVIMPVSTEWTESLGNCIRDLFPKAHEKRTEEGNKGISVAFALSHRPSLRADPRIGYDSNT